jgi:hypothetical protein
LVATPALMPGNTWALTPVLKSSNAMSIRIY